MTEEIKKKKSTPKKKKIKITWTTDKIMSTSALFISVLSLVGLIYQSYLAREENKLIQMQQSASVLPYLNQWYSEYDNSFKLILGNKGVGPAFIKDVWIILDSTKTFDNTNALFNEIFKTSKGFDTIPHITSNLVNGFVLPANQDIKLIELEQKQNIDAFKNVLNEKQIVYKIVYEDIYGTQWQLSNSNDSNEDSNVPTLITKK